MSNLSTSVFKLAKVVFNAKLEVSTCEIFLISTLTSISPLNASYGSGKY